MQREQYLNIKNYEDLHNYLNSVFLEVDLQVTNYLIKHRLENKLIKKTYIPAKTQPIFSYILSFDFFEEVEEIGYNETRVSLIVVLTFDPENSTFDINADISSIYEMISLGWCKKMKSLPVSAIAYFNEAPAKFIKVLETFFNKEFEYRNKE